MPPTPTRPDFSGGAFRLFLLAERRRSHTVCVVVGEKRQIKTPTHTWEHTPTPDANAIFGKALPLPRPLRPRAQRAALALLVTFVVAPPQQKTHTQHSRNTLGTTTQCPRPSRCGPCNPRRSVLRGNSPTNIGGGADTRLVNVASAATRGHFGNSRVAGGVQTARWPSC